MKFGKKFRTYLDRTLPEWRDKYLRYKLLKRLLKTLSPPDEHRQDAQLLPPPVIHVCFVEFLFEELEKFNDFYVDKEEDFIIRFQTLKERVEQMRERGNNDGLVTLKSEFNGDLMEIHKDFVSIHGEMILLKSYSSLNFAGLIKILKKYDKLTGAWWTLPFILLAFHQPFFTTEPLTRLVLDCEAQLEALFSMEPEVVESTSIADEHTGDTDDDQLNASSGAALSLGEEGVNIYQSTLAAISAIQGLKKPSSIYSPLSMECLFGSQDNSSTSDITAENSPSHPLVKLHCVGNGDECVYSPK